MNTGLFKGIDKLVTRRIGLEDVVAKGFEELTNNKDSQIKILVTPKAELLV
jgi:(R,R)-butanediol dehydrogenase / meso-butanediol dehydrogenase / diacetyl reductase